MEEQAHRAARAMMDGGLIEEVRALIDVGLREAKTASRRRATRERSRSSMEP